MHSVSVFGFVPSGPSDSDRIRDCHADFAYFADVEEVLLAVGAVRNGDQRLARRRAEVGTPASSKIRQGGDAADEDSDWD